MTVFLIAFSLFNLFAGAASAGAAVRLGTEEGKEGWASKRLYGIALILAWGMALLSFTVTPAVWVMAQGGAEHVAPWLLTPIAWLLLMGIVFAVVDVSEDGVLDFGRGPKAK